MLDGEILYGATVTGTVGRHVVTPCSIGMTAEKRYGRLLASFMESCQARAAFLSDGKGGYPSDLQGRTSQSNGVSPANGKTENEAFSIIP